MPYTSPPSCFVRFWRFAAVDETAAWQRPEWSSFPERLARSGRNDKLRGIGMGNIHAIARAVFPETASYEFNDERIELVWANPGILQLGSSPPTTLVVRQLGRRSRAARRDNGDTDRTHQCLRRFACACRGGHGALRGGRTVIGQGHAARGAPSGVSAQDVTFCRGVFTCPATDLRLDGFRVGLGGRPRSRETADMAWSRGLIPRITAYRHLIPSSPTLPRSPSREFAPNTAAS